METHAHQVRVAGGFGDQVFLLQAQGPGALIGPHRAVTLDNAMGPGQIEDEEITRLGENLLLRKGCRARDIPEEIHECRQLTRWCAHGEAPSAGIRIVGEGAEGRDHASTSSSFMAIDYLDAPL